MDVFRFHNPTSDTKLEQGEIINGIKTKLWVERYVEAGEFKFVANVDTGVREKLPIGSFVSHIDSTEVMIVENHEISENRDNESEIIITGRGFETYFEQRIVGSNKTFPTSDGVQDYNLVSNWPSLQIVTLIKDHILASFLLDDANSIPYVDVLSTVTDTEINFDISMKKGTLYTRLLERLQSEGLGIKVVRPGVWSPLAPGSPDIAVVIHQGVDRSGQIVFSYDTGEIESAEYLWSNKRLKNAALVSGKWVETFDSVFGTGYYDRRVLYVEASDIDNSFTDPPTGADLTNVINAMLQRGVEAVLAQRDIAIIKAEVNKDANLATFRTDFDVGDIITISGNYNESSIMRISEYVEIEDETGISGYPTLSMI